MSSAPKLRTIEAVQNVEKVRYTTGGGGGSVGLRQNQNYEAAVYEMKKFMRYQSKVHICMHSSMHCRTVIFSHNF